MKNCMLSKMLKKSKVFSAVFWTLIGVICVEWLFCFINFIVMLAQGVGFWSSFTTFAATLMATFIQGVVSLGVTILCGKYLLPCEADVDDVSVDEESVCENSAD